MVSYKLNNIVSHPSHTVRNILYITALRVYKHTSEPAEHDKSKLEYTEFLKARGYSTEIIMEAFRKVEAKPRREYYQKKPKQDPLQDDDRVIPLVTDFNKRERKLWEPECCVYYQ